MTLPILAVGGASIKMASDLNESISAADAVFGRNAANVQKWSKTTADSFGIARAQSLEAAAGFFNFFANAGLAEDASTKMSKAVVELAADMGSFHNEDPTAMLERLRSALAGEVEPLRRFGVNLNAAAVEAKAMQLGLADANGEISEAAKIQARYALLLEKTTRQQGDFARTAEDPANQLRRLTATAKDAAAAFGTALLPIVSKVLDGLRGLAERFGNLTESERTFILVTAGVAASLGPVLRIIGSIAEVSSAAVVGVRRLRTGFVNFGNQLKLVREGTASWTTLLRGFPAVMLGVAAVVGFAVFMWQRHRNEVKRNEAQVQGLIDTLADTSTALTALSEDFIENELSSAGAFDQAEQLGIPLRELMDAALDSGDAFENLDTQLTNIIRDGTDLDGSMSSNATAAHKLREEIRRLNDNTLTAQERHAELNDILDPADRKFRNVAASSLDAAGGVGAAGDAAEDAAFKFSELDNKLQLRLQRMEEEFKHRKDTAEKIADVNESMVDAEKQRDDRIADALKNHQERVEDANQAHQERVAAAQKDHNERIADAQEDHQEQIRDAHQSHQDRVAKAQQDFSRARMESERKLNEEIKKATIDRNRELREVEASAAEDRAKVIADRTRDLFSSFKLDIDLKEGVKFSDIFKDVREQTKDLEGFFRNLDRARRKGLSESAISVLGLDKFSEESAAVLAAITRASSTEIGRLNKQISRQHKAAARQAQKEAKNMLGPVGEALTKISDEVAKKTADINKKHRQRLAQARQQFNKDVAQADQKLKDAVKESTKTLNESIASSTKALNDTVADSNKTLSEAMADSNTALSSAVADANKTLREGTAEANQSLNETAAKLAAQRAQIAQGRKDELRDRREWAREVIAFLDSHGALQVDKSGQLGKDVREELASQLGLMPHEVQGIYNEVAGNANTVLKGMAANSTTKAREAGVNYRTTLRTPGGRSLKNSVSDIWGGVDDAADRKFTRMRDTSRKGGRRTAAAYLRKIERGADLNAKALEEYGIGIKQALNPVLRGIGSKTIDFKRKVAADRFAGRYSGALGRHFGGPIPGMGSGDIVPIMAEPGEHMLTKREVQAAGGHEKIFELRKALQGLKIGGIVQAGRAIQSMGYRVGEHPAFGGVAPVHVPNSYHYRAQAIDVNWPGGNESAKLDQLQSWILANIERSMIRQLIWRFKNHWGHLHLAIGPGRGLYMPGGGPGAGVTSLMAMPELAKIPNFKANGMFRSAHRAARHLRSEAQDWLMTNMFASGAPAGMDQVPTGAIQRLARDKLNQRGWGQFWPQLNALLTKESSWNPNAQNPRSTAFGLFQFLNSTWATVGARKTSSPAGQIDAGLKYIAQRYGNPAQAWAFWQRNNWYHGGGAIPSYLHGTPFVPHDGPAMLHRGEQVVPANKSPQPVQINLYLDGRQVAQLVYDPLRGEVRRRGHTVLGR